MATQSKQQDSKQDQTAAQKKAAEQAKQQGQTADSDATAQAKRDDAAQNRIQGDQTGKPHPEQQPGQGASPEEAGSYPSMGGMKAHVDPEGVAKTPPEGPTVYPAKETSKDSEKKEQKDR